jgi:hypothetical protein
MYRIPQHYTAGFNTSLGKTVVQNAAFCTQHRNHRYPVARSSIIGITATAIRTARFLPYHTVLFYTAVSSCRRKYLPLNRPMGIRLSTSRDITQMP